MYSDIVFLKKKNEYLCSATLFRVCYKSCVCINSTVFFVQFLKCNEAQVKKCSIFHAKRVFGNDEHKIPREREYIPHSRTLVYTSSITRGPIYDMNTLFFLLTFESEC